MNFSRCQIVRLGKKKYFVDSEITSTVNFNEYEFVGQSDSEHNNKISVIELYPVWRHTGRAWTIYAESTDTDRTEPKTKTNSIIQRRK